MDKKDKETRVKRPTTFEDQVNILRSRGLLIEDEEQAMKVLSRINYYRLSAYMLSYQSDNKFRSGVSFDDIYNLYEFDKKLRSMMMGVLETIEIAFRTHIAYLIAHKYGVLGYKERDNFRNGDYHGKMLQSFQREMERSHEVFVQHHKSAYSGVFPVWVAIELATFSTLSKIYSNLKEDDQDEIASSYYSTKGIYVRTWLYALSVVRNICAHHGRLYDRKLKISPRLFRGDSKKGIRNDTAFSALLTSGRLLKGNDEWSHFVTNLSVLIGQYDGVDLSLIGFPANWEEILRRCSS